MAPSGRDPLQVIRRSANAALIGRDDARLLLSTPALLLDEPAFERNLDRMAQWARERGIALRPHAKTHKCAQIARRQIARGAIGVSCATIAEAEAMIDAGIPGVLVTSPLTTPAKLARLAALRSRASDLLVVVESERNLDLLRERLAAVDGPDIGVLVDVDVGTHRTGITDPQQVVRLAQRIADSPGLTFRGVQGYGGHLQHIGPLESRRMRSFQALEPLRAALQALRSAGIVPQIISGAGTGTAWLDADLQLFTEVQPGSYAVMDLEYALLQWPGGRCPFEHALFVATAVVSASQCDRVVVDAGLKGFATDGPMPRLAASLSDPTLGEVELRRMGDEHMAICAPADALDLAEGDAVEFIVPHCDPTINLYDFIHVFRGQRLVDIWPIDARGHG
ncbi:MAG TPA: DSD1 family PLP-dependent enzyme [Burkholderiaceae bacterium]|nr:DSD1 family PLP-dependent enzyme [Burkholderiaceae bacterium]